MASPEEIQVEVVYARPERCWSVPVTLGAGATLRQAITAEPKIRFQAANDPDFPYASQLDEVRLPGPAHGHRLPQWKARGGRQYGEALNFRGLLHAPVNEQGVIFLFATLAADLGFLKIGRAHV